MKKTIHGTASQVLAIKHLCLKYADIFSDILARRAARLPPFKNNVDRKEWERPRNRTAVRLQSVRKEREVKRAIDEMLHSGVIEESDAVYDSYPVTIQKTAELYRFCMTTKFSMYSSFELSTSEDSSSFRENRASKANHFRSYGFNFRIPSGTNG